MEISHVIPLALWGFLVGFVCWGSLFRLTEPVGDWLVGSKVETSGRAIARAIVALFLICLTFLILSLLPIFLIVASARVLGGGEWRGMFMTAYGCSMVGLFTLGFVQRFLRHSPRSFRQK